MKNRWRILVISSVFLILISNSQVFAQESSGMLMTPILIMFAVVYSIPIIIGIIAFFSSKAILKKITHGKLERKHRIIYYTISIVITFSFGIPLLVYWHS